MQGLADGVGNLLRGFDLFAGDVDHADHHVFAFKQRHQVRRHLRVVTLQADLLDAALGQRREDGFVLTPLLAQRHFPVVVGLDAVAVADVYGGGTGQATGRNLQRSHTPVGRLLHVHIEGRLVKLNDVHTVGLQRQRLLVEQFGKSHGHLDFVAVKAVGHGVHNRHRAGQGELDFFTGMRAQQSGLGRMHTAFETQRRDDLRHHGVIPVVANAHLHLVIEVDAFDLLQKTVHKVLARLLTVTDDVQARVFLRLDPQQRGVQLGLRQFSAFGLPLRPELLRLGQPGGFGQAAGNGGAE